MRLRRITLQHVRNITSASLTLDGCRQFVVGANGQGKTNLLEAVGFLTALRSFRASDARLLIAHGQAEAAMGFSLEHEKQGLTEVVIRLRGGTKEVTLDGERVVALADFIGRFPTVVFSSQDQQLIRGNPTGRRRWLDVTIAAMDRNYLSVLQNYHRALAGRNALLKRGAPEREISAFERPLAANGVRLISARADGLAHLAERLHAAYLGIAPEGAVEDVGFHYLPNVEPLEESALLAMLVAGRARDAQLRSTLKGPHRDDFDFTLAGRLAREVASEGQQRTLVLALRMAQAEWFWRKSGTAPLILADDVLGELDSTRRAAFWRTLRPDWQVIATGTRLPESAGESWETFEVANGSFSATKARQP